MIRRRLIALLLWFVASVASLASIAASFVAAWVAPDSQYHRNLLVSHDQDANAMIGGDPDDTVSSNLGKRQRTCAVCNWICRLLNKLDPRHCKNSIEADEGKDSLLQ